MKKSKEYTSTFNKGGKRMAKKLKLGKNKILLGVCSGIAEYLDIDSAIIRILWVLGTIVSIGFGILLYLVFWLIMRSNK